MGRHTLNSAYLCGPLRITAVLDSQEDIYLDL